jgi:DNA modification methylase
LANRVLKKGGSIVAYAPTNLIVDIGNTLQNGGLKYWWTFAVKHDGRSTSYYARKILVRWKPLLWFIKGEKPTLEEFIWDFISDSRMAPKELHPWAQHAADAEHVIKKLTFENGIVLDPFMGSATTGMACLSLGRKFIGVEIDDEHFAVAEKRLKSEHPALRATAKAL